MSFAFVPALGGFMVRDFLVLKCILDRPAKLLEELGNLVCLSPPHSIFNGTTSRTSFWAQTDPEAFHRVFILGWLQASSSALEVALSK